jgi:glycosyltransferase involved in cell wall biosynthesis
LERLEPQQSANRNSWRISIPEMRILQVNSATNLGGGETHVLELVEALRSRGHDVTVAGRQGGAVHPQIHFSFRGSADVISAIRLRQFLKSNAFDIVHAHVARDYTVVAAAALDLPVKVIFTRHLLYSVRSNPLYRRVDGWIAPTSQMLANLDPLRPKRTASIPNWVDLNKFRFSPHPIHQPVHIGLLGQISPHKGHDDAIEALRQLGPGYRLTIAGKGDESYVARLRELSRDLPVEFSGFAEFKEFFEKVDVLLVPSWEEPFGIVILESMATGIPVISTTAGGPLDIIRPGLNGILVPPRNPPALATAVRSLSDVQLRSAIVEHARKRVEDAYDIQKVVPKIEAFYLEVLNKGV